jgi:hypothetical protein
MNCSSGVATPVPRPGLSVRRSRLFMTGLAVMLGWFVLWMVVATTVYRVHSMRIALVGAAVSFMVVAAAGGAIAVKRLYDESPASPSRPLPD